MTTHPPAGRSASHRESELTRMLSPAVTVAGSIVKRGTQNALAGGADTEQPVSARAHAPSAAIAIVRGPSFISKQ